MKKMKEFFSWIRFEFAELLFIFAVLLVIAAAAYLHHLLNDRPMSDEDLLNYKEINYRLSCVDGYEVLVHIGRVQESIMYKLADGKQIPCKHEEKTHQKKD
jgi:hypothetical protein